VANYRVDIELAVQGSQQLKTLTKDIQNVTSLVNNLNTYLETFGDGIAKSYTNVSRAVNNASQALDSAVIGTQEATAAAYQLVRAEQELNEVIAEREKLLRKVSLAGKPTAAPAGGFPTEGPQTAPGFQAMQRNIGRFGENLALGAGFPLLFGGGPGAVGGSILGSFFGTGFGGQILGGALGQALDQAIQKSAQLGSALQQLDLTKLEESGYRVNAALATQINLLKQTGDARGAQIAIEEDILRTTGAIPGTVGGITDAVNVLGAAWADFSAAVSTLLGIIGAPFAAALGAILNAVNLIIKGINVAFSSVGAVLKAAGELVVKFLAGDDAVRRMNEGLKENNQELERARVLFADILATSNAEILFNRELINIEKQRTAGRTQADKLRNAQLDLEAEQLRINTKYDNEKFEINKKLTETNKDLIAEQLRQNEILRKQALDLADIQSSRTKSVITATEQEKRDREAAQQLEKQRKELERISKLRLQQLSDAQDNFVLSEADVNIAAAATDEEKVRAEYEKTRIQRMITFRQLFSKSLSDQEREFLFATQLNAATKDELNLDKAINDTQKAQTRELYAQLGVVNILSAKTQDALSGAFTSFSNADYRLAFEAPSLLTNGELSTELEKVRTELEKLLSPVQQVTTAAEGIGQAFSSSFMDMVNGSLSAQQALANFFQATANNFLNMAAQMIAKYIQMQIIGLATSFLPGGGLFKGAGPYQFGAGNTGVKGFALPNILGARASGGPVSAGQPYLVGERGPELFMPRSSGSIYPNDAIGMAGANIVVNVDASGSNVQGNQPDAAALGRVVGAAVQAELIKQKRPGGLLA
jgi:hypothetical protein